VNILWVSELQIYRDLRKGSVCCVSSVCLRSEGERNEKQKKYSRKKENRNQIEPDPYYIS
jgi:hypothetical protein